MQNEQEIVTRYIHLYNSFQIDEMVELFTDDCLFRNVSNSSAITECKGKQELLQLARQGRTLFTDRQQIVTNWIIGSHKIAVELDYHATLAQDLPNGLKSGSKLTLKGVSIYEFEDNKIKTLVDFA